MIGGASFALLGEASHGTHQFYRERAEITKRLIEEKRFIGVAVEADWRDAYRVNRYVQRLSDDTTALEALSGFRRFPTWMWRNTVPSRSNKNATLCVLFALNGASTLIPPVTLQGATRVPYLVARDCVERGRR